MTLGELIKKYRKDLRLSVYDVAKGVGISHSYITQIENGIKNNPDNEILSKIAILLNIPIEEIINIKILSFQKTMEVNREKIIKISNIKSSLEEKVNKLNQENQTRLEGYVDCLLENYQNEASSETKKNSRKD